MLFLYIIFLYTAIYVWLIIHLRRSWLKIPEFSLNQKNAKPAFLSIIIAARNESDNIKNCLQSIVNNHYPEDRYEILLADDHSEDNTVEIASDLNIANLRILSSPSESRGKKSALEVAARSAKGEILVFTDADCIVPDQWLSTVQSAFDLDQVQMVTGPVMTLNNGTLVEKFQQLDFAATMGITAVALEKVYFPLANGANMAYRKSFYEQSGGMKSHADIASGDDVFMAEKAFAQQKTGLKFLKSQRAIVFTKPEETWSSLMLQRKRWASKAGYYKNQKMNIFQAFVLGFCSLIPLSLILGFILSSTYFVIALILWMVKLITDYFYLHTMVRWFGTKWDLKFYPLSSLIYLLHIFYSAWWAVTSVKTVMRQGSWK